MRELKEGRKYREKKLTLLFHIHKKQKVTKFGGACKREWQRILDEIDSKGCTQTSTWCKDTHTSFPVSFATQNENLNFRWLTMVTLGLQTRRYSLIRQQQTYFQSASFRQKLYEPYKQVERTISL